MIEVGYIPFDPQAVALCFDLVSSHYDQTSMIVSPDKTVSGGGPLIGEAEPSQPRVTRSNGDGWLVPIGLAREGLSARRATPSDR